MSTKKEFCNAQVHNEVSERLNVSLSQVKHVTDFMGQYTLTRLKIGRLDIIRFPYFGKIYPNFNYLQRLNEEKGNENRN